MGTCLKRRRDALKGLARTLVHPGLYGAGLADSERDVFVLEICGGLYLDDRQVAAGGGKQQVLADEDALALQCCLVDGGRFRGGHQGPGLVQGRREVLVIVIDVGVVLNAHGFDGRLADTAADGEGDLGLGGDLAEFGMIGFQVDALQALARGHEAGLTL